MNWERYLEIKRARHGIRARFYPENQTEAKQALALGIIDIGDYVEFSLTMEPLVDAVHDPDPEVRKEAIRKIAERKTPFSVRTLLRMLEDEDEEVRLYSASELDRIEAELQQKIYRLREDLRGGKAPGETRQELAKTYIEYSELLLQDEALRSFYLRKAIELLSKNIKKSPREVESWFHRARAHLLIGALDKASEDLRRVLRLDKYFAKAYVYLSEVYFRLGRFDMVKQIMTYAPIDERQAEDFDVRIFWADEISSRN